jgi:MFS family permease
VSGGGEIVSALAAVFRNAGLRRVELAWAASHLAQVSLAVASAVYAYRLGGASAVGLLYVLRLVPSAVMTPFAAVLGDRFPRARVLLVANASRCLCAAAIVPVVVGGGGHVPVYGLCIAVTLLGTPFRSAQVALLPSLVETPEELTAANVVASTIEGLGFFAGPALAGVLLVETGTTAVFVFVAAAFAVSAFLLVRPLPSRVLPHASERRIDETFAEAVLIGARTIARDGDLRVLVGLFTAQTFVAGALAVLLVVTAIKLLHTGAPGVGWLDAAVGVGGMLGSVLAVRIAGRARLTPPFLVGIVFWGAPFLVIAFWPDLPAALGAFAVIGVGNILVDVAGFTLLQRAVDDAVLARVFGAFEALAYASTGVGALLIPPLVIAVGARWTLALTGLFLPVLGLLCGPRLLRVDAATPAPSRAVALLRALPLFAPLPPPSLERIALHLEKRTYGAGVAVISEGERGDRYYLLVRGAAEVVVAGAVINQLTPGDGFGEIALLRDVPRTATVTTTEPSELLALDRETFLEAVNSDTRSFSAAEELVKRRLGTVSGTV